jgi:hypothetical protein
VKGKFAVMRNELPDKVYIDTADNRVFKCCKRVPVSGFMENIGVADEFLLSVRLRRLSAGIALPAHVSGT